MTKRKTIEEQEENPITSSEVEKYARALTLFPQKRIEGILISPREQYLIDIHAIELRDGEVVIKDAFAVRRIDELDKLVPKQKFHPSPEWWTSVRPMINAINARVIPRTYEDEIPF